MKTKALLSGGFSYPNTENAFRYFREFVPDTNPENSEKHEFTVLNIPFACGVDLKNLKEEYKHWDRQTQYIAKVLQWVNPHVDFYPINLRWGKLPFKTAIVQADIIFAGGGNGDVLQKVICHLIHPKEFKEIILTGKVVGGNSAGANMWANSYYSNDNRKVCEGLDIFPIKTFCHFYAYKWRQLLEISMHKLEENMPTIPLADDQWVKFETE